MRKRVFWGAVFAATAMFSTLALAQTDECSLAKIVTKRDSQSDTDGGTKANAQVTAVIQADANSFIWAPSVVEDRSGSRSPTAPQPVKYTPHSSTKNHEILRGLVLSKATYTVGCYDRDALGNASCTATASISGTQYPMDCMDQLIRDKLADF